MLTYYDQSMNFIVRRGCLYSVNTTSALSAHRRPLFVDGHRRRRRAFPADGWKVSKRHALVWAMG